MCVPRAATYMRPAAGLYIHVYIYIYIMQVRSHRNIAASSLATDCNVPQRPPAIISSFTSIQMVHTHINTGNVRHRVIPSNAGSHHIITSRCVLCICIALRNIASWALLALHCSLLDFISFHWVTLHHIAPPFMEVQHAGQ